MSRLRLPPLLAFVLVSFSANSLITRHVAAHALLDPGLLSGVRFLSGAAALAALALVRRERIVVGRANLAPALWLGVHAACISYGYRHIGAAAGTFVFYAMVLTTLMAYDVVTGAAASRRRVVGAAVSLAGIAVLAERSVDTVTVLGVGLLAATALPPTTAGVAAGLHISASGLAWGVVMGAGTTAFAYVAWYACQRSISATSAGSAQLAVPVLTGIGAVLLLGERLSPALLVAAALVAPGLWLGRPRRAT